MKDAIGRRVALGHSSSACPAELPLTFGLRGPGRSGLSDPDGWVTDQNLMKNAIRGSGSQPNSPWVVGFNFLLL